MKRVNITSAVRSSRFLFTEGAPGGRRGRAPQDPHVLPHPWSLGLPPESRPHKPEYRGARLSGPPKDNGARAPSGSHFQRSGSVPPPPQRAARVLLAPTGYLSPGRRDTPGCAFHFQACGDAWRPRGGQPRPPPCKESQLCCLGSQLGTAG